MGVFLKTERLILKIPELSDIDNLVALRSDIEVMQYTGEGATQTKEQVQEYLNFSISYFKKHAMGFFLVFEKDSRSFIGEAGLFHLLFDDTQTEIEINYHLYKKFWGNGYATELVRALVQWGFEHLSVDKLVATTYPDNIASQKILEKAGFDCRRKKQLPNGKELFWYEIYKNDSIELVPYDNYWPQMAEFEIKMLQEALPKNHILDIQHVGSTAVPGMLAKPIIDIQIAVDSITAIKQAAIDILKTCEYVYWDEDPDPEKMFFVKGMPPFGEKRTHHIHIIEPKAKRWQSRIIFRNYLISHPEAAREYEQLKIKLAQQHTHDREQYTGSKTQFIDDVLRKAREISVKGNRYPTIVFLTGASGAGKTTILNAITKCSSVSCLHFDDIGVPSEQEMVATYGSGSEWQKAMTYHWVKKLLNNSYDKKLVIIEGQVNLDFIIFAFAGFGFDQYKIVLINCENAIRHKRLHQDRNQPELVNDNMDNWAVFLKKQAIDKNALILDTTLINKDEMVSQFKKLIGIERLI